LGAIPEIETAEEHRKAMVFAAFAVGIALIACLLEAGLFWKVHPFL